jgi:hypothetical protein
VVTSRGASKSGCTLTSIAQTQGNFPSVPGAYLLWHAGLLPGSSHSRGTPVPHVVGIKRNAEKIRGYEAKLRGAGGNYADDHAIGAGHHPPLPEFPANENGRKDCKNARDVIQPKHDHLYLISESFGAFVHQGPLLLRGLPSD